MVKDGAQCPKIALLDPLYRLAEPGWGDYPNFQTISLGASANKGKNKGRSCYAPAHLRCLKRTVI